MVLPFAKPFGNVTVAASFTVITCKASKRSIGNGSACLPAAPKVIRSKKELEESERCKMGENVQGHFGHIL